MRITTAYIDRNMIGKRTNEENTKVSITILGDAFVDIFCYLDKGLPPPGGDVRVEKSSKCLRSVQSVKHLFYGIS